MYIFAIGLAFCVSYFILAYLFALFFEKPLPRFSRKSLYSLAAIFVASIITYLIVHPIPDPELANRVQHALGGGVLAVLTCYLIVRDTQLPLSRFQFFALSFLVATSLGVANELLESVLQNHFHFVIAETVDDTWLDLWSNTIGAFLGVTYFVPFLKR